MLDNGTAYCNTARPTLKFYVNGEKSSAYGEHALGEAEKYLISQGDEDDEELQKQLRAVPEIRSALIPKPLNPERQPQA